MPRCLYHQHVEGTRSRDQENRHSRFTAPLPGSNQADSSHLNPPTRVSLSAQWLVLSGPWSPRYEWICPSWAQSLCLHGLSETSVESARGQRGCGSWQPSRYGLWMMGIQVTSEAMAILNCPPAPVPSTEWCALRELSDGEEREVTL